jgi:hypothetical protein
VRCEHSKVRLLQQSKPGVRAHGATGTKKNLSLCHAFFSPQIFMYWPLVVLEYSTKILSGLLNFLLLF